MEADPKGNDESATEDSTWSCRRRRRRRSFGPKPLGQRRLRTKQSAHTHGFGKKQRRAYIRDRGAWASDGVNELNCQGCLRWCVRWVDRRGMGWMGKRRDVDVDVRQGSVHMFTWTFLNHGRCWTLDAFIFYFFWGLTSWHGWVQASMGFPKFIS